MRLLADTHVVAWWYTDDSLLSARASAALQDTGNEVWVSPISAWELATKYRIGKWPGMARVVAEFGELVDSDGFRHLPLNHAHTLRAGGYATSHRDPFDRMLAAQCEIEGLTLVTRDPAFKAFSCPTLW